MTIKIATLNSRGGDSKTLHIIKTLQDHKIDICCIQESHDISYDNICKIENLNNYKVFKCPGSSNGRGVLTIIRETICKKAKMINKDNEGNYLVVELDVQNEILEIVNVYGPMTPTSRAKLFRELLQDTNGKDNRLIGGDFNCIEDFNLDSTGGSKKNFDQRKTDRHELANLVKIHSYVDSFRYIHPTKRSFTFTGITNYRSRLDRIYCHKTYADRIESTEIIPVSFSDHDLYVISMKTMNNDNRKIWGRGFWKLNKTLLEKSENISLLKEMWLEHREEKHKYQRLSDWWETGKRKIKNTCIRLGHNAKNKMNVEKTKLTEELATLLKQTRASDSPRILEIKRMLHTIDSEELNGVLIRSRKDWQDKGEKCTKYFFNLEKKQGKEKQIDEIQTENSQMISTKEQVLSYVKEYFQREFTFVNLDEPSTDILINSITQRLSDDERRSQSGPFKQQELETVLSKMSLNKSPGNDGLTVEFYKFFWPIISQDLLDVINEIAVNGTLPLSMTQALITLIYKNKGSRHELKNWRAISLLNVDFKFLTGLIANRIDPFLKTLIHEDQVCGVNGRYMEDALIFLQNMTDQIQHYGGKSMICSLDLMAAFNKVSHQYIDKVLSCMNFNNRIRNTISTIHGHMYSAVVINGCKTGYFKLEKSIRQGDKMSMTIFILAIEPLANLIRRDRNLSPVILPNTRPKYLSQYCDDTNVYSTKPEDYNLIESHMQTFEKGSGSKFNSDKTEILLFGEWTSKDKNMLPQELIKTDIKILGMWFGANAHTLNERHILTRINETLDFWRTIPLSFDGKRLIIMTKVLSQLYHIIRITGMSTYLKKKVQALITDFIWAPKKMKMLAYSTLQNTKDEGGQNMPNLEVINKAILAERISKVLKSKRPWTGMFIYRLGLNLRAVNKDFQSSRYAHSPYKTETDKVILNVYDELKSEISDWSVETFTTLKKRLHKNNEYRKCDPNRNYDLTWREIDTSTDNRRRKDISYLLAHDALPLGAVLKKRNVITDARCTFCKQRDETRTHILMLCPYTVELKKQLDKRAGRTLSEEEMLYHEGRIKMRKKLKNAIASYKQTIWQFRAKLYFREIQLENVKSQLKVTFEAKL